MKLLKMIIATAVLSAAAFSTANARDSVGININVGGNVYSQDRAYRHDRHQRQYRRQDRQHRRYRRGQAPIVRGGYGGYYRDPGVVYYDPRLAPPVQLAPRVRLGAPIVRVHPYREHGSIGNQYIGRRYRDHSDNRFSRKHHSRHRNNYYGYGDYGRR